MSKIEHKITLTTGQKSRDRYYLIKDGRGMGGAGKPEDHYLNQWVVVNGTDRGQGYDGYYSVDYALSDEVTWIPDHAKDLIRKTLNLKGN